MPRHPPCALHSLSHTPPTQPTTNPHKKRPHHTPLSTGDTAKPQTMLVDDESDVAVHTTHYKDARVHYPDLKQQPHTYQPHTSQRRPAGRAQETQTPPSRRPRPGALRDRVTAACVGLISQNPNSVPPPLVHQAEPHPPTGTKADQEEQGVDDSTSETPPCAHSTSHQHSCWHTTASRGVCSLERR
jgi:hypothetical protein